MPAGRLANRREVVAAKEGVRGGTPGFPHVNFGRRLDRSLVAGTILALHGVQMRTMPVALLPVAVALALVVSGCGSSYARTQGHKAARVPAVCPAGWAAGWRKLAARVAAPVYCPSWLPQPLDGRIGSEYSPIPYVNRDRSYLVSFLWFEKMPNNPYEVHVNLRGYPGRTSIPICEDTLTTGGRTVRPKIPCFADAHGHVSFGKTTATVYTANQGVDTWHVLYAWRHDGSLYTLSQHVAPPFTYQRVVQNLNRMLRGLVLVQT